MRSPERKTEDGFSVIVYFDSLMGGSGRGWPGAEVIVEGHGCRTRREVDRYRWFRRKSDERFETDIRTAIDAALAEVRARVKAREKKRDMLNRLAEEWTDAD